MTSCQTKYFGELQYEPGGILRFPDGLPGFEKEREFLPVEQPSTRPLVYLQSLATSDLCFVGLPVWLVEPGYRLELSEEDSERLQLGDGVAVGPATGGLLCLALLTVRESGTTANLMAPVVANLQTGVALQAISAGVGYSHQHPLGA
jgi:flagellar assembly factor FliW